MIAFGASKNFVSQTNWTPNVYNLIEWPKITFNAGNRFDGRWFTPVQAGETDALVHFGGQIWLQANAPVHGGNYVAKLHKNGVGFRAPIFCVGSFPNTGVITLNTHDIAKAGDRYEWLFYTTFANTLMDGDDAHTYFSGCVVG